MKYFNQKPRDTNIDQNMTESMLADIINQSKKYKFYLNLQDTE